MGDTGATWQSSYPLQAPAGEQLFEAGLQCANMPTDGHVALDIDGPDPEHSQHIPPTAITQRDLLLTAAPPRWPEGFEGSLTISYWQGRTPPPSDAGIKPWVAVVETPME